MTRTEIIDALMAEYLEEVEGIKKYVKMIEGIKSTCPEYKYTKYIKQILKDEYQHQKLLLEMLNDMDAFVPEKISKAMTEAKEWYGKIS